MYKNVNKYDMKYKKYIICLLINSHNIAIERNGYKTNQCLSRYCKYFVCSTDIFIAGSYWRVCMDYKVLMLQTITVAFVLYIILSARKNKNKLLTNNATKKNININFELKFIKLMSSHSRKEYAKRNRYMHSDNESGVYIFCRFV